ncbi:MAG: hypothetical protein MN733_21580 [Nitrososphaera sp.]|nr:hypothetical protein [Nitrososphaera sp.]
MEHSSHMSKSQREALAAYLKAVEQYVITNPYFPHASPEGTDIKHVREARKQYEESL